MSEIYRQYESAAAQCADADGLLELQKKLLLPIIAEEKEAFISAEFGRLRVADKAADYYGWTHIPFKKNGVEREIDEKHEEIYSIIKSAL